MAIEVSRIEKEFILKHMIDSASQVEIVTGGTKLTGVLTSIKSEVASFEIAQQEQIQLKPDQWIDVFFLFKGTRITCRAKIRECTATRILTKIPDHLYRDLTRHYERIRPDPSPFGNLSRQL